MKIELNPPSDPDSDDEDSDDGPNVFGFMDSKLEQQKKKNQINAQPKSNKLGNRK